jgi:hypothetical protein
MTATHFSSRCENAEFRCNRDAPAFPPLSAATQGDSLARKVTVPSLDTLNSVNFVSLHTQAPGNVTIPFRGDRPSIAIGESAA